MKQTALVVTAVSAVLMSSVFVSTAWAQDKVACETTNAQVRDAAEAAVVASGAVASAEERALAAFQRRVVQADQSLAAAHQNVESLEPSASGFDAALDAVADAELVLQEALTNLDRASEDVVVPAELQEVLTRAQAALEKSIAAREEACVVAEPTQTTAPTSTETAAPTTTEAATETFTPTLTVIPDLAQDVDCADLTDTEALAAYREDSSDPYNLDTDGDNLPCEVEDDADSVDRSVRIVPNDAPDTGDGSTL